jgi:hypothetical protein
VVIPGLYQDPIAAGWRLAINEVLGNSGKTVFRLGAARALLYKSNQTADLKSLVADLECGQGGLAGDSERQSCLQCAC